MRETDVRSSVHGEGISGNTILTYTSPRLESQILTKHVVMPRHFLLLEINLHKHTSKNTNSFCWDSMSCCLSWFHPLSQHTVLTAHPELLVWWGWPYSTLLSHGTCWSTKAIWVFVSIVKSFERGSGSTKCCCPNEDMRYGLRTFPYFFFQFSFCSASPCHPVVHKADLFVTYVQ